MIYHKAVIAASMLNIILCG